MEKGQIIQFKMEFCGEIENNYYFFTGETETINGMMVYIMCKCVSEDEINLSSFWKVSEKYLKTQMEKGNIKYIDTFKDIC